MTELESVHAAAFARIYQRYKLPVEKFILKRCGNVEIAKDLSQDVFMSIFRYWHTFDNREDPTAWVFKIARNILAGHYGREAAVPPADEFIESPASGSHSDELFDRMEYDRLMKFVHHLPEPERSALVLHKINNLSLKVTAARIGISERSVSRRVISALEMLRTRMTGEDSVEAGR